MKVFINEVTFEFQAAEQLSGAPIPVDKVVYNQPDFVQIMKFYEMAKEGVIKGSRELVFLVSDYIGTVKRFKDAFKILEAAGGVVKKGDELLFIYRLERWDLPKGKIEAGEDVETAAVREVEEECGVEASITHKIIETWHTYTSRKGNEILKCTHWYAMNCMNDTALAPQTEEDIQEVKWLSKEEVEKVVYVNTYNSIKEVMSYYSE